MSKTKKCISMVWEDDGTVSVDMQNLGVAITDLQKEGIWVLTQQILRNQKQYRTDHQMRAFLNQQNQFLNML